MNNNYPEAFHSRFQVGDTVRHFKWFDLDTEEAAKQKYIYQILGVGKSTVDEELHVIYCSVTDPEEIWIRPLDEFCSEVDTSKFTTAKQTYRFEVI